MPTAAFTLKTKSGDDLYIQAMQRAQPLGPDTSIFLEVIICSDLASQYAVKRTKYPNVWFGLETNECLALRAMFAGVNHDTERVMLATMAGFKGEHGGVILTSGTLKGVIMGHPAALSADAAAKRRRGTLLSFKFPLGADKWHLKTFLLE